MARNRRLVVLALAALGLAGVAIALLLGLRDDGEAAQQARGSGSAPPVRTTATPAPALPGSGSSDHSGGAPVITEVERGAAGSSEGARETVINGVRVRDHRTTGGQVDLPPNIHPPDGRKLQPETVAAINQKVYAVVQECAASVPREARGEGPRLEGQIVVSVKSGQVAVAQSVVQLRRVSGDFVEPAKLCVEQRVIGLSAAAVGGELDVEGYPIQLNYALP